MQVFAGRLTEAAYPESYFDIVTLWHVLEHLPYPRATLGEIHRILKPYGLLVLQAPNVTSLDAKLFGRFWAGLDTPRHLYVFSEKTTRDLLHGTGLDKLELSYLASGYHSFVTSLGFLLDERARNDILKQFLKGGVNSFAVQVISYPYFYLVRRLKKGPSLTVFASKV